jgi:hypothetical protein
MKAGRVYKTSPMPWSAFRSMSENDLKAIYRFLATLKPVNKMINRVANPPEDN